MSLLNDRTSSSLKLRISELINVELIKEKVEELRARKGNNAYKNAYIS